MVFLGFIPPLRVYSPPCIAPFWPPKAVRKFVVFFGQISKANGQKSGDLGVFGFIPPLVLLLWTPRGGINPRNTTDREIIVVLVTNSPLSTESRSSCKLWREFRARLAHQNVSTFLTCLRDAFVWKTKLVCCFALCFNASVVP